MEKNQIQSSLNQCVRCGQCRFFCPVHGVHPEETATPRGKIFLMDSLLKGRIEVTPELKETLYLCLLCRTCAVNCPSGVDVDGLVEASRSMLGDEKIPLTLTKKVIFNGFLTKPALLKASSRLLQLYQKTGLQGVVNRSRFLKLLPGDLPHLHDLIPPIPKGPASKFLPSVTPAKGEKKYRIGYFLGCAVNLLQVDVAKATVTSLSENGCEVVLPQNLKCCGMPHRGYGMPEEAKKLAIHNLKAFKEAGVDAIVTDCASCTSTLMGYKGWFKEEDPLSDYAKEIPIYDIMEFIVKELSFTSSLRPLKEISPVTYHDPCHLVRCHGEGISEEPRILLETLLGSNFHEMEGADVCCGGGGTFNLTHYGTSLGILEKKMASFKDSGASILATACPGCTIQLSYGLKLIGQDSSVVHPVQLLEKSLKS